MTLPAIGFVGLVFLFLFLFIGIFVLILLTKHDLRRRLCDTLASYRNPAKMEKPKRRQKHKKKAVYVPDVVPGPTQLLQQAAEEDETDRPLVEGQQTKTDRSNSFSRNQRSNSFSRNQRSNSFTRNQRSNSFSRNQRSNSLSKSRENPPGRGPNYNKSLPPSATISPAYANNPDQQFAYPGAPLKSTDSHLSGSKDMLGNVFYYPTSGPTSVSSGTSTPQDSSEKKGILKNSSSAGYRNSGYNTKHKSVGYQDEVETLGIV